MKKRIKLMNKFFSKNKVKPNEEVTQFINEDIENAVLRAKTFIGSKKVAKPLVLITPNVNHPKLKFVLTKTKEDEEFDVVYNNTLLTIIFLGEKDLNYHQLLINHTSGDISDDIIGEVKYDNISNTELEITNTQENKGTTLSTVTFDLHLVGNGTLSFDLRNHYAFDEERYLNILTEKEQYVVDTLKRAINTNWNL